MKCSTCKRHFPDHLISKMTVFTPLDGLKQTDPLCPVCALYMRNKIHGLPSGTPFNGELAEANRQEAIKWLQTNGEENAQ